MFFFILLTNFENYNQNQKEFLLKINFKNKFAQQLDILPQFFNKQLLEGVLWSLVVVDLFTNFVTFSL